MIMLQIQLVLNFKILGTGHEISGTIGGSCIKVLYCPEYSVIPSRYQGTFTEAASI